MNNKKTEPQATVANLLARLKKATKNCRTRHTFNHAAEINRASQIVWLEFVGYYLTVGGTTARIILLPEILTELTECLHTLVEVPTKSLSKPRKKLVRHYMRLVAHRSRLASALHNEGLEGYERELDMQLAAVR